MSDKSAIEWTDATWNPVVGCSIVSPGCTNCYAMAMAARIEKMSEHPMADHVKVQTHYAATTQPSKAGAVWTGKVALAPDHIVLAPLHWKKPRRIFVNSMGDLFHESIPDEWIDRVFAVMALCPQHTFQVLTKRADRMREYLTRHDVGGRWAMAATTNDVMPTVGDAIHWSRDGLPNVWLGVSCERQQEADERIPHLLQTPAAIRFVSAEPLLAPIDFSMHLGAAPNHDDLAGLLNWIIVGGESGPHARPMHPQWARDIRDQCASAGVAYFFKQHGEWIQRDCVNLSRDHAVFNADGSCDKVGSGTAVDCLRTHVVMERVGKKSAGRLLDGKEHNEFPNPQPSSFQSTRSSSCGGERAAAGSGEVQS